MVIGFVLVGCSRMDRTSAVSPAESPSPELADVPTIGALEPTEARATSVPTSQLVTATIEEIEVHLTRITEQSHIIGVRWSEDGQSLVYVTGQGGNTAGDWWEYEVSSGEVHAAQPPFELDPELWVELEAQPVDMGMLWFRGALSPSGAWVAYNRLPVGHTYTPAPNEFYLPPYEIWTARSDGSQASRIGRCYRAGQIVWFDQERRIIFDCGYEGPPDIVMANVDGSSAEYLNDVTAFRGSLGFGWMALSPGETKLAITDASGMLQIVPLDGSEVQAIARWGSVSNWSSDNRRLYYLQGKDDFFDQPEFYVYDVDTRTSTKLFSSPLRTSDGVLIEIPTGVAVSPLENAAVFHQFQGLWLVTWSP